MKLLPIYTMAVLGVASAAPAARQSVWSMGYWTPWGNPAVKPVAIEWSGLTHVVYAWALVRPDGSLDLATQRLDAEAPELVRQARAHGVKTILGIGQPYWRGEQTNLLRAAAPDRRRELVANVMRAVKAYGFDGVDLDWEPFNSSADGPACQALLADLRTALGTRPLTAAAIVTDPAFWGPASSLLDRVSVMTYDLGGLWNPVTWHNAALYDQSPLRLHSVNRAVQRFLAAGVPEGKLNIGIPFFGYEFSGDILGPGQRWPAGTKSRQVYYQSLAELIQPEWLHWDAAAAVPYLTRKKSYVTFDNERSVAEKVAYAQKHRLGGWIIWELAGDYLPDRRPAQPLLSAIKDAMKR